MAHISREQTFALALMAAWLLACAQLLAQNWSLTAYTLHDADDMLRLTQVLAWLDGRGWFDLHEPRFGTPNGYDSHWSRLIDAGLGGLLMMFRAFADEPMAKRLMLVAWPLLWLLPTIAGTAAIAWRLGGREAGFLLLLLSVLATAGMGQFRPGRIDHHNVQIAMSVLTVAAVAWSDRVRWAAPAAGILTALALSIGLESLPALVAGAAALAIRFVMNQDARRPLQAYGLAAALAAIAVFASTISPQHWGDRVCDMIAVNWVVPLVLAGGGVALAGRFAPATRAMRFLVIAGVGAGALAVFVAMEPRCLRGPFALMDPAAVPIWLAQVSEMQSLGDMLRQAPLSAIGTVAFPFVALMGVLILLRDKACRSDPGFLAAALGFGFAALTMVMATRLYAHAFWLAMPIAAAGALRLLDRLRIERAVPRFASAMLLAPTFVTLGAIEAAAMAGVAGQLDVNPLGRQACVHKDSYRDLAALAPGLVVANQMEWGPYLLAWTPHAVMAGPYHRMAASIVTSHRILASAPQDAERIARAEGVSYLALCGGGGVVIADPQARAASLWQRLAAGDVPGWLEALPQFGGQPYAVYRVRR